MNSFETACPREVTPCGGIGKKINKEIYIYVHIHTYITLHYITLHYITLHYITYIHTDMSMKSEREREGDGRDVYLIVFTFIHNIIYIYNHNSLYNYCNQACPTPSSTFDYENFHEFTVASP